MKNNKGVTLVELLIVIVVMGIIAAFAVPSVQTIIGNTRKSAVYADALAVEQAADLYCADTLCDPDESLSWTQLSPYVEGIDEDYYTLGAAVAVLTSGNWVITMEVDGANALADNQWEFGYNSNTTPSLTDRDESVYPDIN